jgi:hypothetical protein
LAETGHAHGEKEKDIRNDKENRFLAPQKQGEPPFLFKRAVVKINA